jgi:hypothetical protein
MVLFFYNMDMIYFKYLKKIFSHQKNYVPTLFNCIMGYNINILNMTLTGVRFAASGFSRL